MLHSWSYKLCKVVRNACPATFLHENFLIIFQDSCHSKKSRQPKSILFSSMYEYLT